VEEVAVLGKKAGGIGAPPVVFCKNKKKKTITW
jgi:hypothetical protein